MAINSSSLPNYSNSIQTFAAASMSPFAVLDKLSLTISQLKSAVDLLLRLSFSCQPVSVTAPAVLRCIDSVTVRRGSENDDCCAVCLCSIGEGDEIRELKCGHVFHCPCLDRWVALGHWTCPLCRNHVGDRQVLVFNFCEFGSIDEGRWWLR